MIATPRVITWMNTIRDTLDDDARNRILECFWSSQLSSKTWLINTIPKGTDTSAITVYGGWYGTLGGMLTDTCTLSRPVISIDIDPSCAIVGSVLNPDVTYKTQDMRMGDETPATLIINTSTEHIDQATYDAWWANLPKNVVVILQGNNYRNHPEHIRCAESLEDFMVANPLDSILYQGSLDCVQFTRYMTIGYKV